MITLAATITLNDQNKTLLDYRKLLSNDRSIFDRENISMPSWGVVSNGGNLHFVDVDESIKNLAEQGMLESGKKVELYLENTISGAHSRIGVFYTNQWDYDVDNREVSVSFKDDLEEWQNIQINKVPLMTVFGQSKSAYDIYTMIKLRTPSKYEFEDIDASTEQFLKNYTIKHPYWESGSLWEQWNKLCELCALHIYKNNENKIVIIQDF